MCEIAGAGSAGGRAVDEIEECALVGLLKYQLSNGKCVVFGSPDAWIHQ